MQGIATDGLYVRAPASSRIAIKRKKGGGWSQQAHLEPTFLRLSLLLVDIFFLEKKYQTIQLRSLILCIRIQSCYGLYCNLSKEEREGDTWISRFNKYEDML